ncbi:MAG: Mur ligase family protein [Lentisphaeria bacterium]|nr:Mur ligase family protein [Lentisphaeria bacterium]
MFDTGAYFESLDMFGIRLGLEAVTELAAKAGDPWKRLRFIHLAGTNGKGSTGAMLERAFRECGFVTGFYSSPHLIDIRERFRINGRAVGREMFDRLGAKLAAAAGDGHCTYFEFATVLAMLIFAEAGTDVVIWETGMGGRLDATNMVTPEAAVITNIALDHQKHLGDTLGAIAGEKAGILKPGIPLFHGVLPPEAAAVIRRRAAELACPVFPPRAEIPAAEGPGETGFTYDGRRIVLGLPGKMQRENFRIVYETLRYFAPKWGFDMDTALAALARVRWPARFQQITPRLIVDGGHNPDGVRALTEAVRERFPRERFTVVYAAFGDKHAENCLPYLREIADNFIFTSVDTPGRETFTPEALLELARGIPAAAASDPKEAVRRALAGPRRVIVSGSLYLAGIVLTEFAPETAFDL